MAVPAGIPCLGGYKIRNNLWLIGAWPLSEDEVFNYVLMKLDFFFS